MYQAVLSFLSASSCTLRAITTPLSRRQRPQPITLNNLCLQASLPPPVVGSLVSLHGTDTLFAALHT